MHDQKTAQNFLYAIAMVLLALMVYHYLGIVKPTAIAKNDVNDFVAPLAFMNPDGVRIAFMVIAVMIFVLSASSEMTADTTTEKFKKVKYQKLMLFLASCFGLFFVGTFSYYMFMIGYPLLLITFYYSGGILRTIFAKPHTGLQDDFGFKPCLYEVEHPDNFVWREGNKVLNIESFNQHTSIIAGPGGGKSYTFIEPFIEQAIVKGYSLLIFDFKMNGNFSSNPDQWALTHYAYRCMLKYSKPAKLDENGKMTGKHSINNDRRKFYIINFRDVRYSNRCNPIHPMYLESEAFAYEYALTLLQNMKLEWVKQKDFFADNAILLFKGALWWARNEYDGQFCTLPHVMEFVQHDYKRVLAVLSQNEDCKRIINTVAVAAKSKAAQQLAGVISTLQSAIQKSMDPNIAWILSGNDFSLRLNDMDEPGILCFGSDPEIAETCGPVSALLAKVATKVMTAPARNKSLAILDELPQLAIPLLDKTLAVSRSYNFGFVICGQDHSQYLQIWTKEQVESLLANCNNVIVGQTNNPQTKKEYSDMIGPRDKIKKSTNNGKSLGDSLSKSTGENYQEQQENLIKPHEFGVLKQGEFVGKVAKVNKQRPYDPFFRIMPTIQKINIKFEFPQIMRNSDGSELPMESDQFKSNKDHSKLRNTNLITHEIKDPVRIAVDNNMNDIRNSVARTMVTECLHYIKKYPEEEQELFPSHFWQVPGKDETKRVIEFDEALNPIPLYEGVSGYDWIEGAIVGQPDLSKAINV